MFIDFRKRGSEREKGRNIDVREKHQLVASHTLPDWGLNPQPRHVPQLGIEPVNFWCIWWSFNQLSHLASVPLLHFEVKRTGSMSHSSLHFQCNSGQNKHLSVRWVRHILQYSVLNRKVCNPHTVSIMAPLMWVKGEHLLSSLNIGCCPLSSAKAGTSVVATWLSTNAFHVPLPKCAAVSWVEK